MLAAGWEISWDDWLEHLHVTSPCGPELLVGNGWAQRQCAKDKHSKKARRKQQDFLWPSLDVAGSHFHCILLVNQVISTRFEVRRIIFQLLRCRATCAIGRVVTGGSNLRSPSVLWLPKFTVISHEKCTYLSPRIPQSLLSLWHQAGDLCLVISVRSSMDEASWLWFFSMWGPVN